MGKVRYNRLHEALKACITVALYKKQSNYVLSFEQLTDLCPALAMDFIEQEDIALALSSLCEESLVEIEMPMGRVSRFGQYTWVNNQFDPETDDILNFTELSLGENGTGEVSNRVKKPGDIYRKIYRMEDDDIENFLEDILADFDALPPLRYTDPNLLIDLRDRPKDVEKLAANLDVLVRMIETNNQIIASRHAEISQAVENLKSGAAVIKTGVFSISKIEGLLYGTLAYLASKFADAPIGEAATTCWSLVKSVIQNAL